MNPDSATLSGGTTLWRALSPLFKPFVAVLALALAFSGPASAQSTSTATITGRVSNQATRQFLEKAEVAIEGTNRSVLTDPDGTYQILGLAPGTYTLLVSYTGLTADKRTLTVPAGQTATQDFNLTSDVYKMDTFVVAAEPEGNAAELNKQKKADFFINSISADTLGVVPEGNIGEFLRYMPGVQVNFSNADASTVSMRGQDPEATTFTFDGQVPAAAGTPPRSSTGSSDASSRAFEFTQATIDNIEAIEVYKAPPPWMAPSTGGVINAVTKNAFAQKGRRLTTMMSLSANSEMLQWEIAGPGQRKTERIKPGGRLSYSEAFLNNRLGVSFNYAESHTINPSHNYGLTYSPFTAGTAAKPVDDSTPMNVNTFTLVDGPQAKDRRNIGLNVDYKLGPKTAVKFGTTYNNYLSQNRSHTFRVRPGTIAPTSTTTDATVNNALVDVFADYSDSASQSYGYTGKFEHRINNWRFDGSAAYSKSDSKVTDLPSMIQSAQFNFLAAKAVSVRMQAAPNDPAPTAMTQLAGPDLYDLNNYDQTSFSLQTSPRFQNDRTWNLKLDVRRDFPNFRFPFDLRAGTSLYQLHRQKMAGQIVLSFVGPDGIQNSSDELINAGRFIDTTYGDKFLYGIKTPPLLDPYKVAVYMKQYPNAFQDLQGTNVQRQVVNSQKMAQDITAGYAASTVKVSPKLSLMSGVRVEKTENYVRGALRQNSLGLPVLAAGFSNTSKQYFQAIYSQTQRATSIYTDYFPNFQATYRFTPNLFFRGALNRSMSRPGVQTILPNTTVNDTATIPSVSVNNTALKPTYSRNIDLQLELYTSPAGTVTAGWFKKTITNYIITEQTTIAPGNDNGFDGQYAGYVLNTQDNGGKGEFSGLEFSVRQQLKSYLKALPEVARGWEVFGGYTKNLKGEAPNRSGVLVKPVAPNFYDWNANWGVSYMTPRRMFYVNVRTTIFPSAVTTLATSTDLRPVYEVRHQRWDATLRWRISNSYSLEFTGANLTDDSWRDTIQGGRTTSRRTFGKNYLLSLTADWSQMKLPFIDRGK